LDTQGDGDKKTIFEIFQRAISSNDSKENTCKTLENATL
jgi:hypothetical protein